MKKTYALFLLLFGFSLLVTSCKTMEDEDGNLLNNVGANEPGLNGPRYLAYQLANGDSLVAGYRYNGIKLSQVLYSNQGLKNIIYNGDMINKITFSGKMDSDSLDYTQFYTYNNTGKITSIAETRTVYDPDPQVNPSRYKTLYNIYYDSANGKVDSIVMKTGKEIPGQTFFYTQYAISKIDYHTPVDNYVGNVSKVVKSLGTLDPSGNFSPIMDETTYEFGNYDDKINPFTLLPYGYNLHMLLESPLNAYHLSPSNPRLMTINSENLPEPIVYTTTYTYDPQKYALTGFFGINYFYKPF